ncbi:MAG: UvrB/UvrC motif-containing protein, partial [Candidatus Glassbacteria bacterium]
QLAWNEAHGIEPQSIRKSAEQIMLATSLVDRRWRGPDLALAADGGRRSYARELDLEEMIKVLENEMAESAKRLDFERAALLRDELFECKARLEGKKGKGKKGQALNIP